MCYVLVSSASSRIKRDCLNVISTHWLCFILKSFNLFLCITSTGERFNMAFVCHDNKKADIIFLIYIVINVLAHCLRYKEGRSKEIF